MGALYDSTCYDTADAAAASMCASTYPQTHVLGDGSVASYTCSVVDASHLQITSASPSASSAVSVPVAFDACDPGEHYADLGLAWGLGAVLLATLWALRAAIVDPFMKDH